MGIEPEPPGAAEVFGTGIDLARRYVRSLASEGVVRGLIGPREPGRIWSRHVMNSAVIDALVESHARVVDIGTGAGLPGIPLALARPDCRVDLVEPLERRCRYLREIVEELDLANCRVMHGRAEGVVDQCRDADVVTSRAVASLDRLARWSAPLLRPGGLMLAMKGDAASEELAEHRRALLAAGLVSAEVTTVGAGIVEPVVRVVCARRELTNRRLPRRSGGRGRSQR